MRFIAMENNYDVDTVEIYSDELVKGRRFLACTIHADYFPQEFMGQLLEGKEIALNVTIEEGE